MFADAVHALLARTYRTEVHARPAGAELAPVCIARIYAVAVNALLAWTLRTEAKARPRPVALLARVPVTEELTHADVCAKLARVRVASGFACAAHALLTGICRALV